MTYFHTFISILAALVLFLHSLAGFSKELQELGAEKLQAWLGKITQNRLGGFGLGILLTTLIQSSSAVTSITVSLVDAGVISFFDSLAVLMGANLGTTFTAWLVAFKLHNLGSILLVVGMGLGFLPFRIRLAGKSIFYLGLILFSLELISLALEPLAKDQTILGFLSEIDRLWVGIFIGIVVTILVQSSSVTTGLSIILASQDLLSLPAALAIVIGSNIGTTSTALFASLSLSESAKNAALANTLFNLIGLAIFIPFIGLLAQFLIATELEISYQIALAHLIFNLSISLIGLPLLKPLGKLVLLLNEKAHSAQLTLFPHKDEKIIPKKNTTKKIIPKKIIPRKFRHKKNRKSE
ncbi:Na/Pi cotransporter family protein [Hugenholtzia roseola]|uniref:Na/Pi cotransporter family protein n=1 Tax=Hugenholtzia roseola TaxID=1002 RepID=UPI000406F457|nr:Na/Pi symporter [Hugenholtzia roseola]